MIDRRRFLGLGIAAAAAGGFPAGRRAAAIDTLPTRRIPSTGEALPVIGLGSSEVFQRGETEASRRLLRVLLDHGGRYVDTIARSRYTIGRIANEDGLHDELFLGTYISADGSIAEQDDLAALRELQGGRPFDLLQTRDVEGLEQSWPRLGRLKADDLTRHIGVARSGEQHFARIMQLMAQEEVDLVQINYSALEPQAAERLLPMAADRGVAVAVNRPFINGRYFGLVHGRELPPWAADFDCDSWAQFSLKYILSHAAVTCVLTETANPSHAAENLSAGFGPLPDDRTRERMRELLQSFT